jgi:hypothetical protein
VWVRGKPLVRKGKLLTIDLHKIHADGIQLGNRISTWDFQRRIPVPDEMEVKKKNFFYFWFFTFFFFFLYF